MSFPVVYYPLLLLVLVCLYFVPGRGCFIAANLGLLLRTALRYITAMSYTTARGYMAISTALRTIVDTVVFVIAHCHYGLL